MLCHSYYKSVRRAEAESIDWNMFSVNSRCSRMFYVCSTKGIVCAIFYFSEQPYQKLEFPAAISVGKQMQEEWQFLHAFTHE